MDGFQGPELEGCAIAASDFHATEQETLDNVVNVIGGVTCKIQIDQGFEVCADANGAACCAKDVLHSEGCESRIADNVSIAGASSDASSDAIQTDGLVSNDSIDSVAAIIEAGIMVGSVSGAMETSGKDATDASLPQNLRCQLVGTKEIR